MGFLYFIEGLLEISAIYEHLLLIQEKIKNNHLNGPLELIEHLICWEIR